jgi:hypothetical protein
MHLHLWIAMKLPPQQHRIFRVNFAASKPIGWAENRPDERRRTGIEAERPYQAQVSLQNERLAGEKPDYAAIGFAGPSRDVRREVVAAGAGMGVEYKIR